MTTEINPQLPEIATTLGSAVTMAYLLEAAPPAGRSPSPPVGWTVNSTQVTGYLRISGIWEPFGLWYQNSSDPSQWLLALRGTVTKQDAYVDGDVHPVTDFTPYAPAQPLTLIPQVHPGFWHLYSDTQIGVSTPSMQEQIFTFLQALIANGSIQTLYISGHSLGGALAQLLTLDVALSAWSMVATTTVTYAAPKCGLSDSWGTLYGQVVKQSFAVINQYDIVPTQPKISGWSSVGAPFSLLFFHDQHDSSETEVIVRHSMSNYLFVLQQGILKVPQQWQGTFSDSITASFTDTSEFPTASNIAVAQQLQAASSGSVVAP